jgi:GH18 family chitinase
MNINSSRWMACIRVSTHTTLAPSCKPRLNRTDMWVSTTSLKALHPGLKVYIAIGGWTHSNNGTIWQDVFPDLVSTSAKRAKFIGNLLSFLREYSFDGVDFDW